MKKLALAGIIGALGTAALLVGVDGIGTAEAAKGATIEISPADCARILKAWPTGTCKDHGQGRIDTLLLDADRRTEATRAAGVALLDAADQAALDAKIEAKKDALAAEPE